MFLDYFGLREQPFGVTPDPRFLYLSDTHREALASLYYGIESGRGFLALIATPGTGKSTLLFYLLERLQKAARTAFIFQTQCSPLEFMRSLMTELEIDHSGEDVGGMQRRLNEVLVQELRRGKRFLLVVDEAQGLSDQVLETVRMLSNFETPVTKLMQILLAGQPELARRLANPGLVQLRQRISIVSRLKPLTLSETVEYVAHRLQIAGNTNERLFTKGALAAIYAQGQGIPRNINNLCFQALTLAFAKGQRVVDTPIVEDMRSDLDIGSMVGKDLEGVAIGEPEESARVNTPIRQQETELGLATSSFAAVAGMPDSSGGPDESSVRASVSPRAHALRRIDAVLFLRRTAACACLVLCLFLTASNLPRRSKPPSTTTPALIGASALPVRSSKVSSSDPRSKAGAPPSKKTRRARAVRSRKPEPSLAPVIDDR